MKCWFSFVPVNMLDLICIWSGSAGKHWPEAGRMILAQCLLQNQIRLAKTWHNQPKLNQIQAGFAQYYPGCLWKNGTKSESWKTGSGLVASCQKPGLMIPAHRLASGPDVFGQTRTRPSRSDPVWFCTIWSMPSLEKQSWNGCGKSDPAYTIWPDPGCTLAIMAITGRNQNASGSDLACLLGYLIVIWWTVFSCFFTCYLMNYVQFCYDLCSWLDVKYQASILYTFCQHSWVSVKRIYVLHRHLLWGLAEEEPTFSHSRSLICQHSGQQGQSATSTPFHSISWTALFHPGLSPMSAGSWLNALQTFAPKPSHFESAFHNLLLSSSIYGGS